MYDPSYILPIHPKTTMEIKLLAKPVKNLKIENQHLSNKTYIFYI